VGKDRSGLFFPGVKEFTERLNRYAKTSLIELPESRATGERAMAEEGRDILSQLGPKDDLVTLDSQGKAFDSLELAAWLQKALASGRDLVFAIGGDEGLDAQLKSEAKTSLSLSRFTLPHRLARLVLTEQLYRAFTVLKGEPYHK
jgi:23S rRNA (pseudouridine1915-N3)-methyltransferase